jgi:hypothetical protein
MGKQILISIVLAIVTNFSANAQDVAIDMRYNVLKSEPTRDYFNWSIGDKKIHDAYDAITGASKTQSTKEFDAVRYDATTTRRYTIPVGIRHLLLFPVSSRQYTDNFHLTVHEEGQKLVIRFIVYGTVYQINTDDKKQIDIRNDCFRLEEITVAKSLSSALRPQYVLPGGDPANMASIDWSKIQLRPDIAPANASHKYNGILTIGYNEGILTVKGTLVLQ